MSKLPNAITLCNAICGMVAILIGNPILGSYLIIVAMILDLFDGLVANALDARSPIGKQLDSLADLISFGVAPAYLFYHLFEGTEGLLASIFYAVSALYRLAKFNTEEKSIDFNGLPTPAAAGFVCGFILLYALDEVTPPDWIAMVGVLITAVCMNIWMSFFSLKDGSIFKDWKLWFVVLATLIATIQDPSFALFICFASYLLVSFLGGFSRKMMDR